MPQPATVRAYHMTVQVVTCWRAWCAVQLLHCSLAVNLSQWKWLVSQVLPFSGCYMPMHLQMKYANLYIMNSSWQTCICTPSPPPHTHTLSCKLTAYILTYLYTDILPCVHKGTETYQYPQTCTPPYPPPPNPPLLTTWTFNTHTHLFVLYLMCKCTDINIQRMHASVKTEMANILWVFHLLEWSTNTQIQSMLPFNLCLAKVWKRSTKGQHSFYRTHTGTYIHMYTHISNTNIQKLFMNDLSAYIIW